MARSTGIVLAAGAVVAANEALFLPALEHKSITQTFNWRILPATAGLAVALAGVEQLAPAFATGLAWLLLAAVFIVPLGSAPTPLDNALKVMGYAGKAATG